MTKKKKSHKQQLEKPARPYKDRDMPNPADKSTGISPRWYVINSRALPGKVVEAKTTAHRA